MTSDLSGKDPFILIISSTDSTTNLHSIRCNSTPKSCSADLDSAKITIAQRANILQQSIEALLFIVTDGLGHRFGRLYLNGCSLCRRKPLQHGAVGCQDGCAPAQTMTKAVTDDGTKQPWTV